MTAAVAHIRSRDNPLFKELKRLSQDNAAYRRLGRVWLEGDHLCRAALTRGVVPALAVVAESAWTQAAPDEMQAAPRQVVMADELFADLSALESPARMGFVLDLPATPALLPHAATVVLDRVQDAGNVGSILRSAAAFGFVQVIAVKGTAALWAPKVLRAGMGAHFGLRLIESADEAVLGVLQVPWVVTSSHQGAELHRTPLPRPCAWVLGHEGQGVSGELMARAALQVRIPQPGGEESLNVAAAAAICLYASAVAP